MKYYYKNGVEYARPVDVAELLCESNQFTAEEKEQIRKEAKRYPELVKSNKLILSDWFSLLDKRIGN